MVRPYQKSRFLRPENEIISAVIYTNQFTVPRFFRLAEGSFNQPRLSCAIRKGYYMKEGIYRLDSEIFTGYIEYLPISPKLDETWKQGVTIFLNPNAVAPIDPKTLPSSSVFSIKNGVLYRNVFGIHTLTSFMEIWAL